MKRIHLHSLAAVTATVFCLPLLTSSSLALDLTPKRGGFDPCNSLSSAEHFKQNPELAARCAAAAKGTKPAASGAAGGSTSAGAGNAASGSVEHASIKGTVNGGGDFIGPQLKEPAPKSVSPKARK